MNYTAIVLSVPALAAQLVAHDVAGVELEISASRVLAFDELDRRHRAMRAELVRAS